MKYIFLAVLFFSYITQAAANDPLTKVVEHFDTAWNDANITTGTTRINLSTTKNTNIKLIEQELLNQLIQKLQKKNSEGTGQVAKMKVASSHFKPLDAVNLAAAYAMGNAFSPKNTEGVKYGVATVYAILNKLSTDKNKDIITTTASAVYKENGESRNVQLTALINSASGQQVQFFFIEGKM